MIEVVETGTHMPMTRGGVETFSIANDVAKVWHGKGGKMGEGRGLLQRLHELVANAINQAKEVRPAAAA